MSQAYERDYGQDMEPIRGRSVDITFSTRSPDPGCVASIHTTDGTIWQPVGLTLRQLVQMRSQIDTLLEVTP